MRTSYFVGVLLEASRTSSPRKSTTNSIKFIKKNGKVYYSVGNSGERRVAVQPMDFDNELRTAMDVMEGRGLTVPAVSMVTVKSGKHRQDKH